MVVRVPVGRLLEVWNWVVTVKGLVVSIVDVEWGP